MTYSVEKIQRKILWELYTPVGANKDGYEDSDNFDRIVGNKNFHSFQVWRSAEKSKPTCTYALTLEQLEAIVEVRHKDAQSNKRKVSKLKKELIQLRELKNELEKQAIHNSSLRAALQKAEGDAADAIKLADLAQTNMDTMSRNAREIKMTRDYASPIGKGSGQLLDEAPVVKIGNVTSIPMNGKTR